MTALRKTLDIIQLGFGAFLVAKPFVLGFADQSDINAIIAQWVSIVAGGIAIATAFQSLNGSPRASAGWMIIGSVVVLLGLVIEQVRAIDALVWGLVALAAWMVAVAAIKFKLKDEAEAA